MKKLDVEFVRKQFPGIIQLAQEGWTFYEYAGGSCVSNNVIGRNIQYLSHSRVQPYI